MGQDPYELLRDAAHEAHLEEIESVLEPLRERVVERCDDGPPLSRLSPRAAVGFKRFGARFRGTPRSAASSRGRALRARISSPRTARSIWGLRVGWFGPR